MNKFVLFWVFVVLGMLLWNDHVEYRDGYSSTTVLRRVKGKVIGWKASRTRTITNTRPAQPIKRASTVNHARYDTVDTKKTNKHRKIDDRFTK